MRLFRRPRLPPLVFLLWAGCSGSQPALPSVEVRVTPADAVLIDGDTLAFTARVAGTTDTAVTWSIAEGSAGGSITSDGIYTAPDDDQMFHVVATSRAQPAASGSAPVQVKSFASTSSLTASASDVAAGQPVQLTAVFHSGAGAIDHGVGEVRSGVPVTVAPSATTTYTLTATSARGKTVQRSAAISVVRPPIVVAVSPPTARAEAGEAILFSATVANSPDQVVFWSVEEPAGGTITQGGVYSAPVIGGGIVHVVATSRADPSKSSAATVTVNAPSPPSAFTPLPPLRNVFASARGDTVSIDFDLLDGALDYRVYPLPADADVIALPGGDLAVHNGLYRCAGDREVRPVPSDGEPQVQSGAVRTVIGGTVWGYLRDVSEATLGYVFATPGPDRVPVFALGDPDPAADNFCFFDRWAASRVKKYVSSDASRQAMLAAGWRDDGIAFYAPAPQSGGTLQIWTAVSGGDRLYFADQAEAAAREGLGPERAFLALSAAEPDALPLMRAFYQNGCGRSHDELAAGAALFGRIAHQGNQPVNRLVWSGLGARTVLVVEALDRGCPFQGHLSPVSIPTTTQQGISHQPFLTVADVRAAATYGEVFVNGQHDATNRPRALARSYLAAVPVAPEPFDFHDGFETDPGPFTLVPNSDPAGADVHLDAPRYDVWFYSIENSPFLQGIGAMFGELWVTYSDWASDTGGKFRMTPKAKGALAADAFLHVTMEVDAITTSRRYPQILVSTLDSPVQTQLSQGTTLIAQTFDEVPPRLDLEVCDHRDWDVNNQCPRLPMENGFDPAAPLRPQPEVAESTGVDRRARIDLYASTQKAYLFLDGRPWGCAVLPAGVFPAGPVTVTFGDVVYHSGVDVGDPPYRFHAEHLKTETRRHFDELGFTSSVAAPAWDEALIPCATTLSR